MSHWAGMFTALFIAGTALYAISNFPGFSNQLECGVLTYDADLGRVVAAAINLSATDDPCFLTGNLSLDRVSGDITLGRVVPNDESVGCVVSNGTDFIITPCDGSGIVNLSDTELVVGVLDVPHGGTGIGTLPTGFVKSLGSGLPLYTSPAIVLTADVTGILPAVNGGTGNSSLVVGFVKSLGAGQALYSSTTILLSTDVTGILPAVYGGIGTDALATGYVKSPGPGLTLTTTATIPLTDTLGILPVSKGGTTVGTFTAGFVKSPGGTAALTSSATVVLTTDVSGVLPLVNGGLQHSSFTTGYLTANSSDIISVFPVPSEHLATVLTDKSFAGEIIFLDVGLDAVLYADNSGIVSGVRYEFGTGFNVTSSGTSPVVIHIDVSNFTVGAGGEVTTIVPISFGGTGQNNLPNGVMQVTSSVVSSTTAPVAYGGTGITTYIVGDLLYASGTATLSKLAAVAVGNVLHSGGVGTAPSWSSVSLTVDVSGILPVANGGSGISSYTVGSILYASGTTTLAQLADVAVGSVLLSGGVTTAPVYGKVSLTTHIDTATILPVINGGTNIASYTVGAVLYASASTVVNQLLDVATGNVLLSGGLVTAPSYGKVGLTTHVTGVLPVANGGTNIASYTVGAVLYASASGVVDQLLDIATGNVLLSGGLVTAPSYGKVVLTTHVSGVLPVANGGTALSSYTVGSILYASATTTIAQLADVATGSVLISGGVAIAPSFGKVSLTAHIDTATVLPVINGGTNIASYTTGAILYASSSTVVNQLADIATGNVIISGGVSTAPSYGKVGLTTHVSGTLPVANGGTGATTFTAGFVKSPGGTTALTTSATVSLTTEVADTLPLTNGGLGHSSFTTGYLTANSSDIISVFPIPSVHLATTLSDKTFAGEIVFVDVGFDCLLYADNSGIVSGVRYEFGAGFNISTSGTEPLVIHVEVANFSTSGGAVTSIVPITYGGTGQSSFSNGIMQVTSSVVSSATAPVGYGGTGITTYAIGDILYASGAGTLSKLTAVATGNVLHSGGVGVAPSWSAVSLTADVSGVLPATKGGTDQSSYAVGDILYASTTTALSKLADIATGNVLLSGGVSTAPSYGKVDLTTHVSGTLPVINGGTGLASYTVGSILYASATTTIAQLDDVATGNVLLSGGLVTAPSYGKVALTTHISGVLPVANGGTNIASYTVGAILYASTSGVISQLADVATGNVLRSGGVGVAPAYGQVDLVSDVVNLLGANNGGTGIFAYSAGDMLYYSGSGTALSKIAGSITTKVLHGGSGGAPSWGFVTLTTDVTGILPVANGGTSFATYAVGDMLYASAAGTLAKLTAAVTGNVLISMGVTTAPAYGKVGLSTHTSGTLDLTTQVNGVLAAVNGGTGQSVYAVGDILYASTTTALTKLPLGTTGYVLRSTGSGPGWALVDLASQVSGLLPASSGGTGFGTGINYVVGDILYANAATNLARLADVATGNVLRSGGVGVAPSYGKVDLVSHITGILQSANGGTGFGTAIPYTIGDMLYASSTSLLAVLPDIATGNVLISGGVGIAPSYGKVGLTTHVSGTLPATSGGTGQILYAVGDLLYASTTTALSKLADVAVGKVLISGGLNLAPSWGTVHLGLTGTTHVDGILPVLNGGTGMAAYTTGDLIFAGGASTLDKITAVAVGKVLVSDGVGSPPVWDKVSLTTHIIGTLGVGNGGTGQTTYTNGQLLIGSTSGGTLTKATLTAGNGISITNAAGSITISSVTSNVWVIREQYSGVTNPLDLAVGSNTRNLNSVYYTSGSDVTLPSSGLITIAAGTYDIDASAPCVGCDRHMLGLYDSTHSGDLAYGTIEFTPLVPQVQTRSSLKIRIVIASTINMQLRHWVETTSSNNAGATYVASFTATRIYTQVTITKVA